MINRSEIKTVVTLLILFFCIELSADDICTYSSYSWNTLQKKSTEVYRVRKNYSELASDEVDQYTGCSVCEQDQRVIQLSGIKPFKVCHLVEPQIRRGLVALINQGQSINNIVGYRVGKTRGDVDELGLRTKFSNHSFGIAIDINSAQNGLYENCINFNDECVLIRGGQWNPGQEGSLTSDSVIVETLQNLGLKWGSQIAGKQKDFMHFSPTGY